MLIATLLAAFATFAPFPVGPPSFAPDAAHWTEYADTPAQGRAACLDDIAWSVGPVDCVVVPSDWAPDVTTSGWAVL